MELTLKTVVDRLFNQKWFIVKVVFIFLVGSIVISSFSSKEYTATSKILVESPGGTRGIMSQLGNIPGLNLGNINPQENILSQEIYPEIINSNEFFLFLLNSKVQMDEDSVTIRSYMKEVYSPTPLQLIKKYTIGLGSVFKNVEEDFDESRVDNGITYLNPIDARYIGWIRPRIVLGMERGTSITSVSFESPNPIFSAQLVQLTVNYLEHYLDEYQTQKEVRNLEFIEERKEEAKKEFLLSQHALASFRDRNRNVMSEVSKTKEEVLVQEFNLTNRIYSLLAEQAEQARIKSKENGVLFKILERVQLPAPQTKPQTVLLMMLFVMTGLIISVFYVLFPLIFNEFYEKDPDGRSKVSV